MSVSNQAFDIIRKFTCNIYEANIVSIHNQRGHVKGKRNAENMTIILQANLV